MLVFYDMNATSATLFRGSGFNLDNLKKRTWNFYPQVVVNYQFKRRQKLGRWVTQPILDKKKMLEYSIVNKRAHFGAYYQEKTLL